MFALITSGISPGETEGRIAFLSGALDRSSCLLSLTLSPSVLLFLLLSLSLSLSLALSLSMYVFNICLLSLSLSLSPTLSLFVLFFSLSLSHSLTLCSLFLSLSLSLYVGNIRMYHRKLHRICALRDNKIPKPEYMPPPLCCGPRAPNFKELRRRAVIIWAAKTTQTSGSYIHSQRPKTTGIQAVRLRFIIIMSPGSSGPLNMCEPASI